ncbi:hypothetical protein [Sutcliffiella horikoshii]|uniref:hypothetical protein n=1 Tax=Sutcliffiella horikoshii TaxID=79883 RepID=UPI001F262E47|nr:hypothetical protein [Sutcliffiella horikoshii]MCG1023938.1 hypothetical protein [Sutcliffiella horikoshii]
MLKILSKMVTGLVKEMGGRREIVEVMENKNVDVVSGSPKNMLGRQALKLVNSAEIMLGRSANELVNARSVMRRKMNTLAVIARNVMDKEISLLSRMKAANKDGKEKITAIMPKKSLGVKERISQLFKLPIYLLSEFKFALSLLSKKEVLGVNTS